MPHGRLLHLDRFCAQIDSFEGESDLQLLLKGCDPRSEGVDDALGKPPPRLLIRLQLGDNHRDHQRDLVKEMCDSGSLPIVTRVAAMLPAARGSLPVAAAREKPENKFLLSFRF